MESLQIRHPITYIKGDEEGQVLMDRVLSSIEGLVGLDLVPFDLSLGNRIATKDAVTAAAAAHLKGSKVGLKAPTVTPGAEPWAFSALKQRFSSVRDGICTLVFPRFGVLVVVKRAA